MRSGWIGLPVSRWMAGEEEWMVGEEGGVVVTDTSACFVFAETVLSAGSLEGVDGASSLVSTKGAASGMAPVGLQNMVNKYSTIPEEQSAPPRHPCKACILRPSALFDSSTLVCAFFPLRASAISSSLNFGYCLL